MTLADWCILIYTAIAVIVWHEWANFEFPQAKDEEE
jgi:hypothetical protein